MINWARFGLLLVPALVAVVLLPLGSGTALAVSPAVGGRAHFKIAFGSFVARSALVTPGVLGTDGGRRTDLVIRLRGLAVRNLCASYRGGPYTLRITAPDLDADRLTAVVDSLDGLGVLGLALGNPLRAVQGGPVGELPLTPAAGAPGGSSGPGRTPSRSPFRLFAAPIGPARTTIGERSPGPGPVRRRLASLGGRGR